MSPVTLLFLSTILERPQGYNWSYQGFGMLRLYLAPWLRLHLWHPARRLPGVSTVHDHPWDFQSMVIAGSLKNTIFRRKAGSPTAHATTHHSQIILCGEGSHGTERLPDVALEVESERVYRAGDTYTQTALQWHDTCAEPGTISLILRKNVGADADHATVFWPVGTEWGNAEPRKATYEEIEFFTRWSRARLLDETKVGHPFGAL